MGAVKDYFLELEEAEGDNDLNSAFWDIYDEYMEKRLEGLPLEEIQKVKSYLDRHQWDFAIFVDQMSAPDGEWQKLCEEDWCKRDFLMHEMREKQDNFNIMVLQDSIFNYIKENHMDLLFPDR